MINIVNYILKSNNTFTILPNKVIRKIIKKFRIYFIRINDDNLKKKNYPLDIKYSELNEIYKKYQQNNGFYPLSSYQNLEKLLLNIFKNKEKINFIDFGGQYIDNFYRIKKIFNKVNYFYIEQKNNNKVVKNFAIKNKFTNFSVIDNIKDIKNIKIDFINFGSVIQYIPFFDKFLLDLDKINIKYIFFSGTNFFSGKENYFICKQLNVFPQINYCYFFNLSYFKKIIKKKGYTLIFSKKNKLSKEINYSNILSKEIKTIGYKDLLFKKI